MIIGIIGAMQEELEYLVGNMNITRKDIKANMEFKCGTIWNSDVVAVTSGIGKVNAAICTQILIDIFNVDKIINVGVAGGAGSDVKPGDVVIADSLVQHDVDSSAFGDRVGQIPRLDTFDFLCDKELLERARNASLCISEHKTFVGRIVSGDQFIATPEKIKWLNKEFNALACEMEGASIAQVCYLNNVPFVIIRSISDNANTGAHMDYEKFKSIAVKNSSNILNIMLNNCR